MLDQACNQLGPPGGAKSFPRGAQIFWAMSNILKLCLTHFSREAKIFLGGLHSPGYGPVLDFTHSHVDVETEFGVLSLILIFL